MTSRLPARALAVVAALACVGALLASSPACVTDSGCNRIQSNFATTPSEPCLTFVAASCDAQNGSLKITNNCTDDLQVADAMGLGLDGGGTLQTVAAGQTVDVYLVYYGNEAMTSYSVPALLGSTPIAITYTVGPN